MKYIDLHTHRLKNQNALEIKNILAQDFPEPPPDFFYSVGLHPWHIGVVNWEVCFEQIWQAANDKNMVFIGECGLDRLSKTDFAAQKECFMLQVQIAERCCKPLIIHCVRAYGDLLALKKAEKSSVPWVLHGYTGNLETTISLVKHGFYFSVGERLLNDERKHECLKLIPYERLFFETDEGMGSIEEVYKKASVILEKQEIDLVSVVWNNFLAISQYK